MGTPRYFTWVAQGIPAICGVGSSVRIYDLALLSLRFQAPFRPSSSWIAWVISAFELVRMSISSANASRSPLLTISLSFDVSPSAFSRYKLKRISESTPPYTTPRSAEKEWLPMITRDSWYILTMRRARVLSLSFLHLLKRILQSFSLLTVSYAFWRSIKAAYSRLFLP